MLIPFIFYFLASCLMLSNLPFASCATLPDDGCSCYEPNFTTGSTFQSNLQQLLVDLPRNASQNSYSYNATYGKAPDKVYGLVMCYADATPAVCNNCLSEASLGIVECCGLKKNAAAWYNACMIRYLDVPFNTTNNIGIMISRANGDDSKHKSLADPQSFKSSLRQLIDGLATNASKSDLKMAAGTTSYNSSQNIYSVVQCTRQVLPVECRRCISDLTDFVMELSKGRSSVLADQSFVTVSCYLRFAFDPFYVITEAHPPWSNTGKLSKVPVPTQIFTIIVGALLIIVI